MVAQFKMAAQVNIAAKTIFACKIYKSNFEPNIFSDLLVVFIPSFYAITFFLKNLYWLRSMAFFNILF
jgi:hypothetical protein